MSLLAMRLRCGVVAERVTLPDPFDLGAFLASLAAERGRPIVVVDYPLRPDGLTGLVVALDEIDYVVVTDRAGAGWQRLQIVLHEVAHLLLGHIGPADDDLRRLFPAFGPELVRRSILHRGHGYPSVAEQEAEVLATLLLHRVRRAGRAPRTGLGRARRRLSARLRPVREAGTYLRLYPLWRLLYDTVDGIALEAAPRSRLADLAALRDVGFRLQRRLIEIDDGLLRLGPYLASAGLDFDTIVAAARRHSAARARREADTVVAGAVRRPRIG
jgi:uncharacterized protein DUF6545